MSVETAGVDDDSLSQNWPKLQQIQWTPQMEVDLFCAMRGHKPVGVDRFFQMACIHEKFSLALQKDVSSQLIWDHLEEMYDLVALNESEIIPFPNKKDVDFNLSPREFGDLLAKRGGSGSAVPTGSDATVTSQDGGNNDDTQEKREATGGKTGKGDWTPAKAHPVPSTGGKVRRHTSGGEPHRRHILQGASTPAHTVATANNKREYSAGGKVKRSIDMSTAGGTTGVSSGGPNTTSSGNNSTKKTDSTDGSAPTRTSTSEPVSNSTSSSKSTRASDQRKSTKASDESSSTNGSSSATTASSSSKTSRRDTTAAASTVTATTTSKKTRSSRSSAAASRDESPREAATSNTSNSTATVSSSSHHNRKRSLRNDSSGSAPPSPAATVASSSKRRR